MINVDNVIVKHCFVETENTYWDVLQLLQTINTASDHTPSVTIMAPPFASEPLQVPVEGGTCDLCNESYLDRNPHVALCRHVFCEQCLRDHYDTEGDEFVDHTCPVCEFVIYDAPRFPRESWTAADIDILLSASGLSAREPWIAPDYLAHVPTQHWQPMLFEAINFMDRGCPHFEGLITYHKDLATAFAGITGNMIIIEHARLYESCEIGSDTFEEWNLLVRDFIGLLQMLAERACDVDLLRCQLLGAIVQGWRGSDFVCDEPPFETEISQTPLIELVEKLVEGALYPCILATLKERVIENIVMEECAAPEGSA